MSDTAPNDPIFPSYAGYLYVPREKHTLHFAVCYCRPQSIASDDSFDDIYIYTSQAGPRLN